MARANPPLDTEPVAVILQGVAGYVIKISFPTQDAAIAYAKEHGIKTKVTHYGY